jgi:hypothetical protein
MQVSKKYEHHIQPFIKFTRHSPKNNMNKHNRNYFGKKNLMKKIYLAALLAFTCTNFLLAQNYTRVWVNATQDSTADYLNISDMAVDANGNTYLSGYEVFPGDEYYQTHLVLLKVNAAGQTQWKKYFNNQKDSIDAAIAVATDAAGNVYVTGKRIDTFCNICTYSTKISDIITMKYDGAGNRIWLNRYHDSALILAEPADITLSSNGTILITGNERRYVSQIGTYVSNLLIQKINSNGQTTLIKKMNNVVGASGCFDNGDSLVIVGASDPDNLYQTQKPMALKFTPNGTLIWSNVFNEFGKNGKYYFVQCDAQNNIYTNGQTDTNAFFTNPRIITIKYNVNGQQQWFKKEADRTTTRAHSYGDFKIDAAGNSYVAGYINKSGVDDDWVISKYNNAGVKSWTSTFDGTLHGSDKPIGLAVSKSGGVYVAGYVLHTGGFYSITTAAYNGNGGLIAADIFNGIKRSNAFAAGIGLDKNNNVYVGGFLSTANSPFPSSILIKYGPKRTDIIAETPAIKNEIILFPNPAVSNLNILLATSTTSKNYKLVISDVSGNIKLVKQLTATEKTINTTVDVSSFKQGVYTVSISDGVNTVSKTFIKE